MKIIYSLIVILILFNNLNSHAQGLMSGDSDRIDGKAKFIPIPYFNYDNTSGFTLGALPLMMFNISQKDTISPSSVAGAFGMYSQNKTWFTMAFTSLYLMEDKWRITVAAGMGDFPFQTYINPINKWVKYNTNADFVYLSAQRRIIPNLYTGLIYSYNAFKTNTSYSNDSTTQKLHGLGFEMVYDKRSNVSYPRSGYYIEADFMSYPSIFGNKLKSNQSTIAYNHYYSTRNNNDVFATRIFGGFAFGEVDFNQQFIISDDDIRGYSQGKYRGNQAIALQCEYRWNFHRKFGAVGFAGVATVFGSNNTSHKGKLLPSIGCGLRYTYMSDTHSNIGIDIAKGIDDWSINFRISEAF